MSARRLLLVGSLASGCVHPYFVGDPAEVSTATEASSATIGDDTLATESSADATTGSTDASTTTTTASTTSTDDTATTSEDTSSGDESSSTTGSNTDPDPVEAHGVPGGLDRVWINASNVALDRCVTIVLVWPMTNDRPALELPVDWAVQEAWASPRAADCESPMSAPVDAIMAGAPSGVVSWAEPTGIPCELDVDVVLPFAAQPPWLPAALQVLADGVVVMGC